MSRFWLSLLVLVTLSAAAQEVPLDSCRQLQLPVVKATIGKQQVQFLLDTGAASTLLNSKSFSSTESTEIVMQSWNGSSGTHAREVVLHDLNIGEHSLFNLKLLAIDLTPVERSCQKRIDGVLGADLIAKFGLTIDLKNRVATLDASAGLLQAKFDQLDQQRADCVAAFNRSDDKAFEKCLDPDVVLLTSHGDFHGRNAVMKHFRESYFWQSPPVVISFTPVGHHVVGSVIWTEYDMVVTVGHQVMKAHGTALYQKTGEHWLMSNMNYSVADPAK